MARTVATRYLGLLIGAFLSVAVITSTGAGDRREFLIELDGTFAEFVMYCRLVDGNVTQTIRRREFLPESYAIEAEAVNCTVTMLDYRGRISGRLYAGGQLIASAEQNAIRPIVKLRSDGPWGSARGARSSVPIYRVRPMPEPRPPTTPVMPPDNPGWPPVDPWTPAPF
jgi:hypothetical protein